MSGVLCVAQASYLYDIDILVELLLDLVDSPLIAGGGDSHARYLVVIGLTYGKSIDVEAAPCKQS